MTLADAGRDVGERGAGVWLLPALVLAPAAGLATIVLPVRAGLRRLWAERGLSAAGAGPGAGAPRRRPRDRQVAS